MSTLETEFHQALTQLVGLPLAAIRRAADLLVLHFGTMRIASKVDLPSLKNKTPGSIGEIAIHIQCPWRIESEKEILTGRSDLWKPLQRHEFIDASEWDFERDGNLQDERIQQFMDHQNASVVDHVMLQNHCSLTMNFSSVHRLVVFPSGSVEEDWRLFRPESKEPHWVVVGGKVERHDA